MALTAAAVLILAAVSSLYVQLQHRYGNFDNTMTLEQVRAAEIRTGGSALTAFGEFTPRWRTAPFDEALLQELGPDFDAQKRPLAGTNPDVRLLSSRVQTDRWELEVEAAQPTTLTLHLLYYPRWQAWLDGDPIALRPQSETGYAQVDVPAGAHRLELRYGGAIAQTIGLIISGVMAATLIALVAVALWRRRRRNATHQPAAETTEQIVAAACVAVAGIDGLLGFKAFYVDPHTTWLRCVSTPDRVCGADASVSVPFAEGPRLRGYAVPSSDGEAGRPTTRGFILGGRPGDEAHPAQLRPRP